MPVIKLPAQRASVSNPFYQMRATLNLLQQMPKLGDNPSVSTVVSLLDAAYAECHSSKEKKELFYILMFSFGDISNREHNLFRKRNMKDVDQGGSSMRKVFAYCLEWLLKKDSEQYYKFLPIIGEYYNLDACGMMYQLTTDRYKGTLTAKMSLSVDIERITDYIASVLKNSHTTENEKKMWAKWLWHIPTITRQRKFVVTEKGLKSVIKKYGSDYKVGDTIKGVREKQNFTKEKDVWSLKCIKSLSEKMGWLIATHPNNVEFVGYKKFRTEYLKDSEATMFSQGKIKELDKVQLFDWFNQLASGARFRTQCRLVEKEGTKFTPKNKWVGKVGNIGSVYIEWLNSKEVAQQAVRNLTDEDKEKMKKEQPDVLKQMVKAAKVNTGADTLMDAFASFFSKANTIQEIDLRAQSILDKINIQVPVLPIIDVSGSMSYGAISYKGNMFTAKNMAALATTIFLMKNPSEEAKDFFVRFDTVSEVITKGQRVDTSGSNRFMKTSEIIVPELIDKTKPFSWNYNSVAQHVIARRGTNISSVTGGLKKWVDEDPITKNNKIEMIQSFPVILLVSDGDLNNYSTPIESMQAFQSEMRQFFGWDGLIVIWDVKQQDNVGESKFNTLDNIICYGGFNVNILNQIFRNIHDLDIIDPYTPLQSFYKSNRYLPVKELVI